MSTISSLAAVGMGAAAAVWALRSRAASVRKLPGDARPEKAAPGATCLVTGGMGYIASHTILQLLERGYSIVILDNLSNSSDKVLERLQQLSGKPDAIKFVKGDTLSRTDLTAAFAEHGPFEHVLHFAALKAVGESVSQPLKYYSNNLTGTLVLLEVMQEHDCTSIVFSSSATVYGTSPSPITEESPVGHGITNPYGQTKFMIEQVLQDVAKAPTPPGARPWRVALLRYFNPVGAHPSGLIGEDPLGPPNNLNPYILQVAVGRRPFLSVFGNDYDTEDGTGERDYLHVQDLATGHLAAIQWLERQPHAPGAATVCEAFNLGTGRPVSVLQAVKAVEAASGKQVPVKFAPRREGDLACVYADPARSKAVLGWEAKHTFEEACRDGWKWQSMNPQGFAGPLLPEPSTAAAAAVEDA